jgi:MSHA pilin protein MshD
MNIARPGQRGTTLIELIVAITVIGIAVLSVMSLFAAVATHSGETLVREQATAIASAYLDEVTSKPFLDPGGVVGETVRSAFDDVDDYNGLNDVGARNQQGLALAGLNQFTVTVRVGAGVLGAVPANEVKRIDVTVSHSAGISVSLSAYRTRGLP